MPIIRATFGSHKVGKNRQTPTRVGVANINLTMVTTKGSYDCRLLAFNY